MSLISSLYRLQQIDSQIDQARQRLKQIDEILNNLVELQAAEAQYQHATRHLEQQKKSLHQCETQVGDHKIKIQQSESALYGGRIRNPKELQDLQKEVAALKRYLEVLEDRQLECMLGLEEAEKETAQTQMLFEQTRGRIIEQHAGLLAEQTNLNQILSKLAVERQAAENAVPAEQMDEYDQLRRTRHGIAVAQIINRTCAACGSGLSQAVAQTASQGSQVVNCPMCGRMLYP